MSGQIWKNITRAANGFYACLLLALVIMTSAAAWGYPSVCNVMHVFLESYFLMTIAANVLALGQYAIWGEGAPGCWERASMLALEILPIPVNSIFELAFWSLRTSWERPSDFGARSLSAFSCVSGLLMLVATANLIAIALLEKFRNFDIEDALLAAASEAQGRGDAYVMPFHIRLFYSAWFLPAFALASLAGSLSSLVLATEYGFLQRLALSIFSFALFFVPSAVAFWKTRGYIHYMMKMNDTGGDELRSQAAQIDISVRTSLATGDLRVLSCAWLLKNMYGSLVKRFQDMPEEAFVPPDQAADMHDKGNVFVLSYGWLQPGMPDPYGMYLNAVLIFLQSLTSSKVASSCLFWDFLCLPQWPRDPQEDDRFGRLLDLMGNLYGSLWKTTVLQHQQIPPKPHDAHDDSGNSMYNAHPYFGRGWCIFEDGASRLAAGRRHELNMQVQPKLIDISQGVPQIQSIIDPPRIADLESRLMSGRFTGKGDRDKVAAMLCRYSTSLQIAEQDDDVEIVARRHSHRLSQLFAAPTKIAAHRHSHRRSQLVAAPSSPRDIQLVVRTQRD